MHDAFLEETINWKMQMASSKTHTEHCRTTPCVLNVAKLFIGYVKFIF